MIESPFLQAHGPIRYIGLFLSGICHQFPEHSLSIGGAQLPLCARCTGTYLGALVGLGACWWRHRLRASWLPPWSTLALLALLFGFWAVDGVNSYAHYVTGRVLLYPPQNSLRLAAGLANGLVLSIVTYPMFNFTLWRQPDPQRMVADNRELFGPLLSLGVIWGIVQANIRLTFYPLAVLSGAGLLLMLTLVNSMIVLLLLRKENRSDHWRQALPFLGLGLLCAFAEVGGIAILRYVVAPILPPAALWPTLRNAAARAHCLNRCPFWCILASARTRCKEVPMKFSCLQENLAKGLAIVGRAVATRSTLPVLSNILIATDEGRLKLSATNLEVGVSCWIGAKVKEDGATTVPARLLTDFVHSLPAERIDAELATRTQTLNLRCSNYEANIKGIDAQEFPILSVLSDDTQISLEPTALRQMINQVSFAAAVDESRPVLTGVLVEISGSDLTMAAADGFRLSVRKVELPGPPPTSAQVIVPARALQELARISAEEGEPIRMTIAANRSQIYFRMTDIDLISQLVEGNFPDYKQIIPTSHSTHTVAEVGELLKAVKIASLFARDAANVVRVRITPGEQGIGGRVTVMATSADLGDNVTEIEAAVEGEPIEIAFNAKYLTEVLSVISAPQVTLKTTSPSSPGVIQPVGDESFVHVIMPMHIAR